MIYNLSLFSDVAAAIEQAIRSFFGLVAALIYDLLAYLYNIFDLLSRAELLGSPIVSQIYRKAGMILGLFMTFKLIFSLIQALIDPNKLTDNKKGATSIIFRLLIAIVLLGTTPFIFKEAMNIQRIFIGADSTSDNVIYKLILGNTSNIRVGNFGQKLASDLFFSFYTDNGYDNGVLDYDPTSSDRYQFDNYDTLVERVENGEASFKATVAPLVARNNDGSYAIDFNPLFVIIIGCVVAWLILMYCVQVAVRVFQLAFLEIISPIPILSYISDPEGIFKKWINLCVSTYIDLFLRLAIIYFVVYLAGFVLDEFSAADSILFASMGNPTGITKVWIMILLVVGLLLFAKKVPDLLKEIFPNFGGKFSFGLSPKKNVVDPLRDIGKAAWNSPLGWLPKAGMKTATFADRKIHGLPAPRSKFGQAMDKWLPGRAEVIKNKNQAEMDAKRDRDLKEEGMKLYNRYGDDLPEEAFKNKEYRATYSALQAAKKAKKSADDELKAVEKSYDAAYKKYYELNTDPNATAEQKAIAAQNLENVTKSLDVVTKNQRIAQSKLDQAQSDHDINKKRYEDDARREASHSYYKNITKTASDIPDYTPNEIPDAAPQPQQTQSQQQETPTIEIVETFGGSRKDSVSEAQKAKQVQDEHAALVDKYNKETDPEKRKQIMKEIDEFEKNH